MQGIVQRLAQKAKNQECRIRLFPDQRVDVIQEGGKYFIQKWTDSNRGHDWIDFEGYETRFSSNLDLHLAEGFDKEMEAWEALIERYHVKGIVKGNALTKFVKWGE